MNSKKIFFILEVEVILRLQVKRDFKKKKQRIACYFVEISLKTFYTTSSNIKKKRFC